MCKGPDTKTLLDRVITQIKSNKSLDIEEIDLNYLKFGTKTTTPTNPTAALLLTKQLESCGEKDNDDCVEDDEVM